MKKIQLNYLLILGCLVLILGCKKNNSPSCEIISYSKINYNYPIGELTDSSALYFPKILPKTITFKSNKNQINELNKDTIKIWTNKWIYNTIKYTKNCTDYHEEYSKSVKTEEVQFIPFSQPNFYHQYNRTRYTNYISYLNISNENKIDSNFEIISVTLIAPLNRYNYLIPIGPIKEIMKNYQYYDTINLSGILFKNIYHIYSDSAFYDRNKIIPQGIYYHKEEGLVGYYLTNGEIWLKQ